MGDQSLYLVTWFDELSNFVWHDIASCRVKVQSIKCMSILKITNYVLALVRDCVLYIIL